MVYCGIPFFMAILNLYTENQIGIDTVVGKDVSNRICKSIECVYYQSIMKLLQNVHCI